MTIRATTRDALARSAALDAFFRRWIWSRLHFPEIEILKLARMRGRPFDVAVDVGAALGSYTWVLGRKSRTVVAFEPGVQHFRALQKGAWASNVTVVNSAVGRSSGIAKMYTLGEGRLADHTATLSVSNPLVESGAAQSRDVTMVSLDEYFDSPEFVDRTIDCIKVDVEGFEFDVLEGTRKVLATHRPLVICEIEARHNSGYAEVFKLMESLGYESRVYSEGRYVPARADNIPALQSEGALVERLSGSVRAEANRYLNNFVFCTSKSNSYLG